MSGPAKEPTIPAATNEPISNKSKAKKGKGKNGKKVGTKVEEGGRAVIESTPTTTAPVSSIVPTSTNVVESIPTLEATTDVRSQQAEPQVDSVVASGLVSALSSDGVEPSPTRRDSEPVEEEPQAQDQDQAQAQAPPSPSFSSPPPASPSKRQIQFSDQTNFAPVDRQLTSTSTSTSPERPAHPRRSSSFASASASSSQPIHSHSRRSSSSSPTPKPKPTLSHTTSDLKQVIKALLVVVPSSLHRLKFLVPPPLRRFASFILSRIAMVLHRRGALASSMFYDLMVMFWKTLINVFFREIRSRGAWKVPKDGEGAVIFVVGPHHNQFLDPLLLMSEVRREAGRRISFLVAAKSMDRKFIGQAAKLMQSIPVARAQDLAVTGKGTITISPDDPTIIIGQATEFKTAFSQARSQIMLPRSLGSASVEVAEVLDDGKLRLKKEFHKKVQEGLKGKGGKGVTFKVLPYVDQTKMYSSVYQKLAEGGCIGIFPEGGSHDRTDLLPLKAGVSIMALGALSSDPNLRLQIVPVGLSYFHPHKFRSRAVVEFGTPIDIPPEFVQDFEKGGDPKKKAIGEMMELVVDGLKSVTVRAPDFETLMLIQAARRLYRPPGQHLTLGQIIELNKRFIVGWEVYREEPRVQNCIQRVKEYNTLLKYMGLKDHQIERVARPFWKSFILLCYRLGLFSAWSVLALPGVILNAPIFIAAKIISHRKAKEALAASTVKIKGNDVLATWKVLVALTGAPTLYTTYAIGATVLAHRYELSSRMKFYAPVATLVGLPLIAYSTLKFGEVGMDVYKSLRPLLLSVIPGNHKQLDKLRVMRESLQMEINALVEELAPAIFQDFDKNRIVPPSSRPPPVSEHATRRRSSYGPQGQGTFFTHPMSWVDEYLFGWSSSTSPANGSISLPKDSGHESDEGTKSGAEDTDGRRSGYVSGYTTEEPDYDEVIGILSREQAGQNGTVGGADETMTTKSDAGRSDRYRRNSRNRSRSQLDLTALHAVATGVEDKSAELKSRTNASRE